jgi:hypothetical protein
MFHLWTGGGGDSGLVIRRKVSLPLPRYGSSLSDLVYTLVGDMHDTSDVSMQQVACTDAHSGDRHFRRRPHRRVAMGTTSPAHWDRQAHQLP